MCAEGLVHGNVEFSVVDEGRGGTAGTPDVSPRIKRLGRNGWSGRPTGVVEAAKPLIRSCTLKYNQKKYNIVIQQCQLR